MTFENDCDCGAQAPSGFYLRHAAGAPGCEDAPAALIEALGADAHCAATIEALAGITLGLRDTARLIEYCRGWALDCEWQDASGADISGMPAAALLAGAHRAYDGGLRQALADCRASACDCGALDIEHASGLCPAPAIESLPIEECELGVRAYNICKRQGIHTLAALAQVTALDCNRWALESNQPLGLAGARQIIEAQARIVEWQDAAAVARIEADCEDADYAHTLDLTTAPTARKIETTFAPTAIDIGSGLGGGNPHTLDVARARAMREASSGDLFEAMRADAVRALGASAASYTAIYRAPIAPGSDRSIFEQSISATSMAQAMAVAHREASARGLAVVGLAVGAPDGFGAAILAAGLALD